MSLADLVRRNPPPIDQIRQEVITTSDIYKDHALYHAVSFNTNEEVVRILLENNASADALIVDDEYEIQFDRDNPGFQHHHPPNRVLHEAFENRQFSIMKILIMAGATTTKQYKHRGIVTDVMSEALLRRDREMIYAILESVLSRTMSSGRNPSDEENIKLDELWTASISLRLPDPARLYTFVTADYDSTLTPRFPEYAERADQDEKDLALAYAVHYRKTDMVKILLRNNAYADGAELMSVYKYGTRALRETDRYCRMVHRVLQQAYDRRDFNIIGLLLNAKASLRFEYQGTEVTVPMHAILHSDKKMLIFFIDHDWNVNERTLDWKKTTPLFYACSDAFSDGKNDPDAFSEGEQNEMIEFLLDQGADPDMHVRSHRTHTNVHACLKSGNRKGLQILMQHGGGGVDINVVDDIRQLVNMYHTYGENVVIPNSMRVVDGVNIYPSSALHSAIFSYLDFYQIEFGLSNLEGGPHEDPDDPDDVNDEGDETKRRRGIIKDILKYNVDFEFTGFDFAMDGVPDTIKKLVLEYRDRQTVKHLMTLTTTPTTTTILPKNHVDYQDEYGRTALHRAVKNGQLEAVRYLVRNKNANKSIRDMWGNTASEALGEYMTKLKSVEDEFVYYQDTELNGQKLSALSAIGKYLFETTTLFELSSATMRQNWNLYEDSASEFISDIVWKPWGPS
jgi:ankyrin repeat protein